MLEIFNGFPEILGDHDFVSKGPTLNIKTGVRQCYLVNSSAYAGVKQYIQCLQRAEIDVSRSGSRFWNPLWVIHLLDRSNLDFSLCPKVDGY